MTISILGRNGGKKPVRSRRVGVSAGVVYEISVDISDHQVVGRTWRFPSTVESRKQRSVIRSVLSTHGTVRGEASILRKLPIVRRVGRAVDDAMVRPIHGNQRTDQTIGVVLAHPLASKGNPKAVANDVDLLRISELHDCAHKAA